MSIFSMFLVAALLGFLCVLQIGAQNPDDLLAIEQLADKNYVNHYNSWEYPYYFLPGRFGRNAHVTVEDDTDAKTLPAMEMPLTLSNPIVSIINRANKFYRMVRNSESPSKQYLLV